MQMTFLSQVNLARLRERKRMKLQESEEVVMRKEEARSMKQMISPEFC